jgi:OOP family OmpA-OmpF porin
MSSTLLDTLTALITPDVVTAASRQLGDSEDAISAGLNAGFSSILLGLLAKAENPDALRPAFDLIMSSGNDGRVLDDPRQLLSAGPTSPLVSLGGNFLSAIFGSRLPSITHAVSDTAGLRGSTATSLLYMATPLVMALLELRIRRARLDTTGLADLLSSQRESFVSAAPAAVSGRLGLSPLESAAQRLVIDPPRSNSRRWFWPALAALVLIALLWGLTRARHGSGRELPLDPAGSVTGAVSPSEADGAGEFRVVVRRKLPGGLEVNVPERGTEDNLISFIEDPARPIDETTWFDFDRLDFETGSAELLPSSREQLLNVAAILKGYPSVELKIGGYTEDIGDAAANLRLSQARADNVREELIAVGIEPDRVEAEGHGPAHHRRISLRVTEK